MTDLLDISHLRLTDQPLVVCDVDDVVLAFLSPFECYLAELGHRLLPRSFRLHGNIVSARDETVVEDALVSRLILDFFEAQEQWQTPLGDAVTVLKRLSGTADIVFLTAMPPRYSGMRRRLLDRLELPFPLIATESPKGPVVRTIHAGRNLPLAFIDDMAHNLFSVGEEMPDCLLVQLMPESEIHRHAPKPGPHVVRAADWGDAAQHIDRHFADRVLPEKG